MAAAGSISHNTNLKNQIGSNWSKVGENVGYGGTVQGIYEALLDSPSHLRNILDPEFERLGVGVVVANSTVWLVQDFLTPKHAAAVTAPLRLGPRPRPLPLRLLPRLQRCPLPRPRRAPRPRPFLRRRHPPSPPTPRPACRYGSL